MIVSRCMDDKTCRTCEKTMDIDIFDEGFTSCEMCLSDKRTNNHKHKHKPNAGQRNIFEDNEEYRKMKQDYTNTFQSKMFSCSVCDCSMTQVHYYKQKKTEKHRIHELSTI